MKRNGKVISAELQGHGHTVGTDRRLQFQAMADHIGTLNKKLNLGKADVVGYSLGGGVALRTAIQHHVTVRRTVLLSAPYAHSGWFPEIRSAMADVSATMLPQLKKTP